MLSVKGPVNAPPSPHGDLWFAAARALIRAGRDTEAAPLLERLQAGHERVVAMESYARSFFLLAQLEERRGNAARAREQYARFVELWRDGDLERGWVAEVRRNWSAHDERSERADVDGAERDRPVIALDHQRVLR